MIPKRWVTTFAFIFMIRHEKIRSTWNTSINSDILGPPMISSEWSFVTYSLRDIILKWTQVISSSFSSLFHTNGTPLFKWRNIFPFSKITINGCRLLFTCFGFGSSQYGMSYGTIVENFYGINFINPTLNFSNEFWTFS